MKGFEEMSDSRGVDSLSAFIQDFPQVTAVILNYKNYEETADCARAFLAQSYPSSTCVIVDNASPNESIPRLRDYFAEEQKVILLSSPTNGGYASGNNLGARFAKEELKSRYILILNPDVLMTEIDTVARLVEFAERNDDAAVISPKVVLPGGFIQGPYERPSLLKLCFDFLFPLFWLLRRKKHQRQFRDSTFPTRCFRTIGACMLVRASTFTEVGMFDENTFMGGEEPILAEKLNRIGKYFYHFPEVQVSHNHNRPSAHLETIDTLAYYFREYRRANRLAIAALRLSARIYSLIYEPIKPKLDLVE